MQLPDEIAGTVKKKMFTMLIWVGVVFGLVFGYKLINGYIVGQYIAKQQEKVVYVSVAEAKNTEWQPQFKASGSLRAIIGVNVTTTLAGMIKSIHFTPGAMVKKGDLLVQLDIDPDTALLHVYEANAALADITYRRDKSQYAIHAISKAALDTDAANYKATEAQVAQQKAVIAQKTIRAPFAGRLGISAVNPGQYLNPGDKVTMLQTLDPIYVDFYVPQQSMAEIKVGQQVSVMIDAYPQETFVGKITTIDPGVDTSVRNVQVEATIPNTKLLLSPGMFASIVVNTGTPKVYLTLPQTALSFNSYGETVYIVKSVGKDLVANQAFVVTGEKRGDQVMLLEGVKPGDQVVTSGQMKLKNGSHVAINNTIVPTNDAAPMPIDN